MPSFNITIDDNTYEITIPEPDYEVPTEIMKHYDDLPMFCEDILARHTITNSRLFDRDVMDAYHKYVISKSWTKSECDEVDDLINEYYSIKYDCKDYLADYVDWDDLWSERVRDKMPKHAKFDEDEVIRGLIRIVDEIDEKTREWLRKKNKAILERKIAELQCELETLKN
jgi:hypothetical protein